jgi:ParB family chromosome partitioning protein
MRKALGKGLEALFPGTPSVTPVAEERRVSVHEIVPNPEQPRRTFSEEGLAALAQSIRKHGLLQPLLVRPAGGRYELIAGERRLRAARQAGLETVPVMVRDPGREERFELALIENLQREDLTPLEEAEAYRHLIEEYGLTQEEVAGRVGKSRPAIANALRLLTLPEAVKVQLEGGELTAGHARAILAAHGAAAQAEVAREVTLRRLSVREAERVAARRHPATRRGTAGQRGDVHLRAIIDELTRDLGTRVRIQHKARGGTIEIEFYSDAELDRLVDRLRGGTPAGAVL